MQNPPPLPTVSPSLCRNARAAPSGVCPDSGNTLRASLNANSAARIRWSNPSIRNQPEIIKHLRIYLCSTLEAGHHRCRRRSACLYIWLHRPMRHIPGAPPPLEPALISHARFNHFSIPHPSHAPMDMLRHMEGRGASTPIIRCNVATATPMTKNEADMAVLIALQRGASIGLQRPAAPTLTTNNAPIRADLRRP